MPEIRDHHRYEPSSDSKELWLATRKRARTRAGVTLPGLFQTARFPTDAVLFVLVIVFELVGAIALIADSGWTTAAYVVLGCMGVDFLLARWLHSGTAARVEAANRRIVADENALPEQERIANSGKVRRVFVSTLLIIIGCFKGCLFLIAHGFVLDPITYIVFSAYLFAAIIHILATWYWVSEILTAKRFRSEHRKLFAVDINREAERDYVSNARYSVLLSSPDEVKNATCGKHKINKLGIKDSRHYFYFETWGLLLDSELDALITSQTTPGARWLIATEGLKHQLDMLHTNANTAKTDPPTMPTDISTH